MNRFKTTVLRVLTAAASLTIPAQAFAYTTPTAGQFMYTLYTAANTIIGGAICWLVGLFCLYEAFKLAFKGEYTKSIVCVVLFFVVPFIPQELAAAGMVI